MKASNEFIERYNSDEEFRNEVKAKTQALKGSGAENLFAAVVKVAESLGYAVTEDEVKSFRKAQSGELSDELLDNTAGGFPIAGGFPRGCSSCSASC